MLNLKELTDTQLIERIKQNNCSDSIVELTKRHQGLVAHVAKRYANATQSTGISLEDFLEDSETLVFNAVRNFDETKNTKFSTWLGNNVGFHCKNALTRESRYYSHADADVADQFLERIADEDEVHEREISLQSDYIMHILDQIKDKRVKQVIEMYYFSPNKSDRVFGVIAKKMNMSKQGVINLHDDFINFIRKKIKSNENMDKI